MKRKGQKKTSHDEQLLIVQSYQSGKTLKLVAEEFGLCLTAVHYVLKRHNIERRPPGRPSLSNYPRPKTGYAWSRDMIGSSP